MTPATMDLYGEYRRRCATASDITDFLPLLHGYACLYRRGNILEIGTRDGHSTMAFLAAADITGGHVWSVDIADVIHRSDGMHPWKDHPRWTFTQADSLDASITDPGVIDLLFLDGDHGYKRVLDELRRYVPRMRNGGTVLAHDTRLEWDGEPQGTWPVSRALDDYCAEAGLAWRELPGLCGLGVITLDW